MTILIAIPARYGSTRFPGKPLAKIAGKTMLARVVDLAREVAANYSHVGVFVTTDDERIKTHAEQDLGVECIMTPEDCESGTDRVSAALQRREDEPDFVINLQGDAPFTPPAALHALIEAFETRPYSQILTPVHRLSWSDLDRLRKAKKKTPHSGTTAAIAQDGQALWFSKTILPAIRKEKELRKTEKLSPVWQHMGLYGFRPEVLRLFCASPPSIYERLEGLEQLRAIENGIKITAVPVEIEDGLIQSGIDSPEDLRRAEKALKRRGL